MPVFTVGYGGRDFTDFVTLLREHGIDVVVDVRRYPRSRVPEYCRENLELKLPEVGLSYVFLGDLLGGFRPGGYTDYMASDAYRSGIERIVELADHQNVVLMCKEREESGCHRKHIARTLNEKGVGTVPLGSERQQRLL